MSRNLPPLRALRAFEAAARHSSFAKAADELNVTPGAISHQIRTLEEWLGSPLFERLTRALRLTRAGEAALHYLTEGFDRLADGVARMRAESPDSLLTISVSPSFGSLWLVPRLHRFRQRHPDIELRIDGTARLVDIARGEVDVAIRYGPGAYEGTESDRLFDMRAIPVCSPDYLASGPILRAPPDLKHHTLFHVEWEEAEGTWRNWLLAAGATGVDPFFGPRFTKEEMAVRAALNGEGILLMGDRMAADHLSSGRLVRPFAAMLGTPLRCAYRLLRTRRTEPDRKVELFRRWLLEEVAASEIQTSGVAADQARLA